MNLSNWVAEDIKIWYFTQDKWIHTFIIDLPARKIVSPCQDLSVTPNLNNMFWEVYLTRFSFFSFWSTNSFLFVKKKIYTLCSRTDLIILRGQKLHVGKFLCDICIFFFFFFVRMSQNRSLAEHWELIKRCIFELPLVLPIFLQDKWKISLRNLGHMSNRFWEDFTKSSLTCLKQAVKGTSKIACSRQVLA